MYIIQSWFMHQERIVFVQQHKVSPTVISTVFKMRELPESQVDLKSDYIVEDSGTPQLLRWWSLLCLMIKKKGGTGRDY
jgi:hypothetical protein